MIMDLYCSFCKKKPTAKNKLIGNESQRSLICQECVSRYKTWIDDTNPPEKSPILSKKDIIPPMEIKAKLDEYVIGQEHAKKALSVAVYNHYKKIYWMQNNKDKDLHLDKSNILLIGPTGCGKTLLAKTLSKILQVPLAIADATSLTEAGYVGDDVENILLRLIQAANYNIHLAEHGIIYVDEIDKITRKSANPSITRDVSGEGVQQALLKIIEDSDAYVSPQGGRKHPQAQAIKINTKNILFICGGAFVGLEKIIKKRLNKNNFGFSNSEPQTKKIKKNVTVNELNSEELLSYTNTDDLTTFGFIPEFIGRLPVLVNMHHLSEQAIIDIISKPKNALLKQYKILFDIDGIDLSIDEKGIKDIAKAILKRKVGARGTRAILEGILLDIMFNSSKYQKDGKLNISREYINEYLSSQ